MRIFAKDNVLIASTLYYALPLVLIGALFGVAGLLCLRNRRRLTAMVLLIVALTCVGAWVQAAHYGNSCGRTTDGARVLLWNTARGIGGWSRVARTVRGYDADIIGLVEATARPQDRDQFWREEFPGYQVFIAAGELVVLTRGDILEAEACRIGPASRCARVRIDWNGRQLDLMLVDVVINPLADRSTLLDYVARRANTTPQIPTVLLGDFNTPVDSVWLSAIRARFDNAFEVAGNGILATWPLPLPVLALDQVWVSDQLGVSCAKIGWSMLSDHRPVFTEIRFEAD